MPPDSPVQEIINQGVELVRALPLRPMAALRIDVHVGVGDQLLQDEAINADSIDVFVRAHRSGIELAIKSHILARGLPVGGYITLGVEELRPAIQK